MVTLGVCVNPGTVNERRIRRWVLSRVAPYNQGMLKRIILLGGLLVVAATSVRAADLIADVKAANAQQRFKDGEALVSEARRTGETPVTLEAWSWLGRGALAAQQYDAADRYAREAEARVLAWLKTHPLDAEEHVPLALGAAFEVQAQVLAAQHERSAGVSLLQKALQRYGRSSIQARLQKNLNLLSLAGQPLPSLGGRGTRFGAPMPNRTGKVTLVFLWAHWCSDCKSQGPIIAELEAAYRSRGLVVVGLTGHYGYVKGGAPATPDVETKYIDDVRREYYGSINMAVPVDDQAVKAFGVSTTPTIVIADRQGRVAAYHPGKMTRAELDAVILPLLDQPATPTASGPSPRPGRSTRPTGN